MNRIRVAIGSGTRATSSATCSAVMFGRTACLRAFGSFTARANVLGNPFVLNCPRQDTLQSRPHSPQRVPRVCFRLLHKERFHIKTGEGRYFVLSESWNEIPFQVVLVVGGGAVFERRNNRQLPPFDQFSERQPRFGLLVH